MKGLIGQVNIGKKTMKVIVSTHAKCRQKERHITNSDILQVLENASKFEPKLRFYQLTNKYILIQDPKNNISIIINIHQDDTIHVLTVINKGKAYATANTEILTI